MNCYLTELGPLFVAMKVLGWMPLQRVTSDVTGQSRLEWRLTSWRSLYSAAMVLVHLLPMSWALYLGFQKAKRQAPGFQFFSYFYLVNMALPMFIPVLIITFDLPSFVKLCNSWSTFQDTFCARVSRSPPRLGISRWCRGFVCVLAIINLPFIFVKPFYLGLRLSVDDFLHIMGMNISFVLLAWWYATCRATCQVSHTLLISFKILRVEDGIFNIGISETALAMRLLWLQLHCLVQNLGNALALTFGFGVVVNFGAMLFSMYQMCLQGQNVFLAFSTFTIVAGLDLYVVCRSAQQVQDGVYRDFLEVIDTLKQLQTDLATKQKMLKFFVHLSQRSPKVTFNEYMTVGSALLGAMLTALVTNLAVLLQLQLTQTRLESLNEIVAFSEVTVKDE